jgi:hypothetical protein
MVSAFVGTLVSGGIALGYALASGPAHPKGVVAPSTSVSQPTVTVLGSIVTPKQPRALAVGPTGNLYVADIGRDQILSRLSDGKFRVVAGSGRIGFSGDDGPAIDADLRLNGGTGLAVAGNGMVYFSDSGNDRVRAVLPNGDIETVAGGGQHALPTSPGALVPALSASLGATAGLAFGPNNELYIAASFIVRLTSTGKLAWVAGSTNSVGPICSSTGCPVREYNFQNADALAFDGDGDLVVSPWFLPGGYDLVEVRASGKPIYIRANARGVGGKATALASGTQGSVVWAAQNGLYRLANGSESPTLIPGSVALSDALGPAASNEPFLGGDGIAVGPNGEIYVDTSPNATATPYAILELSPTNSAKALWRS